MKNYIYNTNGILSEKLFENFADNLIPVDAIEIYSPCQKLTDKNSDKWTPKYIKKSGCAKKNNRYLRGKNGGKTWKHGSWQPCKAEDCKDGEENLNCLGKWGKCNKYCKRKFIIEREVVGTGTCPFEKDKEYDCVEPLFNDEIQKGLQGECDFKNIPKKEEKETEPKETEPKKEEKETEPKETEPKDTEPKETEPKSDNKENNIEETQNSDNTITEESNNNEVVGQESDDKSYIYIIIVVLIIILLLIGFFIITNLETTS